MCRVVVLALWFVSGCVGTLEDLFTPPEGSAGTDAEEARLHRLTAVQYRNTMRDLLELSEEQVAPVDLPTDESEVPSLLTVTRLDDAASYLASLRAHHRLVPCDVLGEGSPACASQFLEELGRRAFRHPLTAEEKAWLEGVFTRARGQLGFADAIDVVTRVMLQAPQAVYVYEEGSPDAPAGSLSPLNGWERASRLSYLLWDSMPDEALFAAAAEGRLATPEGMRAEAERMLDDPRALAKAAEMMLEWLELHGSDKHVSIEEAVKDTTLFPNDSPELRLAVLAETRELAATVWQRGGSVGELFTSTQAYVNGPLAELYGVSGGPAAADQWAWVELPATERAGVLTRAAFLLVYATPRLQSPIRRGVAVWRRILCHEFPPPPPNASDVEITPNQPTGGVLSIREAVTAATGEEPCVGCHGVINPAGFAFGHYDALGGWVDEEAGTAPDGTPYRLPIDDSAELIGSDIEGPIAGALDLSTRLAQSAQVQQCLSSRLWQAALGRMPTVREATSMAAVQLRLAETGSLREALLAIIQSTGFTYIRRPP